MWIYFDRFDKTSSFRSCARSTIHPQLPADVALYTTNCRLPQSFPSLAIDPFIGLGLRRSWKSNVLKKVSYIGVLMKVVENSSPQLG